MRVLERFLWSLPERVWLHLAKPEQVVAQEEVLVRTLAYLWLTPAQLRRCRALYRCEQSFLQEVLEQVYRPLLQGGKSAPFPIVVLLAVGYALGQVAAPSQHDADGVAAEKDLVLADLTRFIARLNRWLDTILASNDQPGLTEEERASAETSRANWPAVRRFVAHALALEEIGVVGYPHFDPGVCDSSSLYSLLWSSDGHSGAENRLLHGLPPVETLARVEEVEVYLSATEQRIEQCLPPETIFRSVEEDEQWRVKQQRTRGLGSYLIRAGVSSSLANTDGEWQSAMAPGKSRRQMLDLHALAGYQTFAKFIPDPRTTLLLELLRRQQLDPTMTQRTRESTVEGMTRRGSISQLLKWQLALKDTRLPPGEEYSYVYERFFNHKMLYLRRISRQSQDLSLTLLVVIDLSAPSHQFAHHGARVHSILREVCAHLVQDAYQVLWQVPKLFADALIIAHDGNRVVWRSTMVITTGNPSRPIAEDVFLKPLPEWLTPSDGFADPPAYFHFLPAVLISEGRTRGYDDLELGEQIAEIVREARRARMSWVRGMRTGHAGGAALPIADLLVSLVATATPISAVDAAQRYEAITALGLVHQLWLCDVGERVNLRSISGDAEEWADWSSFVDFQQQNPGHTTNQHPTPLRQAFIQDLLRGLLALCEDAEFI
jgi:hypothetical protein